jgi:hypothetical protein
MRDDMAIDDEKHSEEIATAEQAKTSMDIKDLYKVKLEDIILNISSTHYSNLTYMQVAPREVVLDFLELPGIKRDGKLVIDGVRVYLSHVAAEILVEKLGKLLEKAYKDGNIAQLKFAELEDIELSTETSRPTEEEQT